MATSVVYRAGASLPDGNPQDVFEVISTGLKWLADRLGKSLALRA